MSNEEQTKFTIATAIPYLNAAPHLGQALEYVYSDVIARYHKQLGEKVVSIMGADEHGQKIARKAEEKGKSPQGYVDALVPDFLRLHESLNLSYDQFVRTSSPEHRAIAQALWKRVAENGYIEQREYEGLYCVGCEEYKTDDQLVDGKCPEHNVAPETVKERNYFFLLSAFQQQIETHFEQHPEYVVPEEKRNEMRALLERGLFDVSISRDKERLTWGVPVPGDDSQVMYVWFDALANYLTGAGVSADAIERGEVDTDRWPVDRIVIGKDINRFHSHLFPGMLLAAGLPVPKQIAVHGFITVDGQKMSKTIGNVIDPFSLIELFGTDATRYLLMAEVPFRNDGDISMQKLLDRYTSDLSNGIGNLLSRSTNVIEKFLNGKVRRDPENAGQAPWLDAGANYQKAMEEFRFHDAISEIQNIVAWCDAELEQKQPWVVLKETYEPKQDTEKADAEIALDRAVAGLTLIAELLQPFMPDAAEQIYGLVTADSIVKAAPLFPRIEIKKDNA